MSGSKKITIICLVFILALTLVVTAGCTQKSMEEAGNPEPQQNPQDAQDQNHPKKEGENNAAGTSEGMEDMAENAADVAADVEGVKSANVVVLGNTALIGVDLDKDIEEEKVDDIKNKIDAAVKDSDSRVKNTSVTADPDLMARIQKVAAGINEGRPISEFWDELTDILKRVTPSANQT